MSAELALLAAGPGGDWLTCATKSAVHGARRLPLALDQDVALSPDGGSEISNLGAVAALSPHGGDGGPCRRHSIASPAALRVEPPSPTLASYRGVPYSDRAACRRPWR